MALLKTISVTILSFCMVSLSLSVSAQTSNELSFLEQMVQSIGQIPVVLKGEVSIKNPVAPADYLLEPKGALLLIDEKEVEQLGTINIL